MINVTPKSAALNTADLTPAAAWSRRVRCVGGFIQAAFAAFWLGRASLTIGGRAGDVRPACPPGRARLSAKAG